MDFHGVAEVCEKLGLLCGKPYGGFVSVGCPLAFVSHTDPHDTNKSCSIRLDPDGPSYVRCFSSSCDYSGSLWYMLQRVRRLSRPAPSADLAAFIDAVVLKEQPTFDAQMGRLGARAETVWNAAPAEAATLPPLQPAVVRSQMKAHVSQPRGHDRDVLLETALAEFSPDLPEDYMQERRITAATATTWGLCYDARLGRVVFPVRRFDGALVGMTGRITPTREKESEERGFGVTKYHNYSGLNKTRYLYGAHLLREGAPIVITEGPFDALMTWQALKERAAVTATLGQGFSMDHRQSIKAIRPKAVYLFLDDDPAGWRAAEKIAHALDDAAPLYLMRVSGAKDPGGMTEAAISAAFDAANLLLGGVAGALRPDVFG